jgi:hypothetical protein
VPKAKAVLVREIFLASPRLFDQSQDLQTRLVPACALVGYGQQQLGLLEPLLELVLRGESAGL